MEEEYFWSDEEDDAVASGSNPALPSVVRLLLVFLVSWQCMFHVPDGAVSVLVVFIWHFLRLLSNIKKNDRLKMVSGFLPKTYSGLL